MVCKSWVAGLVVGAFFAVLPGVAVAQGTGAPVSTLGSVTQPSGSSPNMCSPTEIEGQVLSSSAEPFTAPGGGWITRWQTNTAADHAGDSLTLVVLRPSGTTGDFTIVALDPETLPSPLPAGNVVTFVPSAPIAVQGRDTLGLIGPSSSVCYFSGGDVPDGGIIAHFADSAPSVGQNLSTTSVAAGSTALDLAATFVPTSEDAGVTTTAGPGNATAGYPAVLSSTVTNAGLDSLPITFTDQVPAGLRINSAVAGSGTCTTAMQTVTCTLDLARGASAPVQIVVTPGTNGSYQNDVTVSPPSGVPDFNPGNDNASSVLLVLPPASRPPTARCVVPRLRGIQAWFAQRVLGLLGCQVGKVTHVHSRNVAKGSVIGTTPGAGTYAAEKVVTVQVSSGPAKKRHRRHGPVVGRVHRR
jgi:hypothetical protein